MPERLLKRSLRLEALLAGITVPRRLGAMSCSLAKPPKNTDMKIIKEGKIPTVKEWWIDHTLHCGHCGTVVKLECGDDVKTTQERRINGRRIADIICPVCQVRITYTAPKRPCEACGGNGGRVSANSGQIPRHCETCDGTGEASQENA